MNGPEDLLGSVAIRAAVMESVHRGELPNAGALRLRFPGAEALIEKELRSASRFRDLEMALRRSARIKEIKAGTVLGEFEVLCPLASGGMAQVYRARQAAVGGRTVAVKIVRRSIGSAVDAACLARLVREASIAGQLHHPNLAEIHACGDADGIIYVAMRLVEGPSLREVLDRLRAKPGEAVRWRRRIVERVAEVASALAAVHEAGLVHGDVKPSNVVLESDSGCGESVSGGRAVLVDFGLARDADTSEDAGALGATVPYAAPEVLRGLLPGPRADVFGLGATLHDLLTGRTQADRFDAALGLEVLTSICPGLDPDLAAVVAKAVDPKPEWRYRDATELHDDLVAWLEGRSVSARRPRIHETVRRLVTERWQLAVLLGCVSILIVLIAGWAVLRLTQDVGHLHNAQQALARADLGALGEELAHLREIASIGPVMTTRMEVLANSYWSETETPLQRFSFHHKKGEHKAACHAIAEYLIRNRAVADPVYMDGLAFELANGDPVRQAAAALAASRLFMHAPDLSPEAVEQSRRCRDELVRIAFDKAATVSTRLDAIAALGGCGLPRLVKPLLERTSDVSLSPEERRVTAVAAGEIFFRAQACGQLDSETSEPGFHRTAVDFSLAAQDPLIGPDSSGLCPMILGWFTYWRDTGRGPVDLRPLEPLRTNVLNDFDWSMARSISGDLSMRQSLENGPSHLDEESLREWGTNVRLLGESETATAARQTCRHLAREGAKDPERWIGYFEEAYRKQDGQFQTRAVSDVEEPSAAGEPEWITLASSRADAAACERHEETLIGHWDLSGETLCLAGWAQDADGENAKFCGESFGIRARQTHWRLNPGGESRLRLLYECEGAPPGASVSFVLFHQAASRNSVPWRGRAYISVVVDEAEGEADSRRVEEHDWVPYKVPLPAQALLPGRHSLTIELRPWSTTTYWIRCAGIVVTP